MYEDKDDLPGSSSVIINSSEGKGRHIVCGAFIPERSIIGRIPVVVVPREEVRTLGRTLLYSYVFEWDAEERYKASKDLVQCDRRYDQGVALGLISLCNHSDTPNSDYEFDYPAQTLIWRALRDIRKGEEVTIHYKVPLWFEMYDETATAAE